MDLREVWAGIMMIDWMQKNVSRSSSFHKWKIKTNLKVLGNGDWELCRSMYEIIVITFDESWIIFLRLDYLCFILSLAFLAVVWIISFLFFYFHWHFLLSFGLFLSLAFLAFFWIISFICVSWFRLVRRRFQL